MTGNDWKLLEMVEMEGKTGIDLIQLEMAGNGMTWLEWLDL